MTAKIDGSAWNAYAEFEGEIEIPPTLFVVPGLGLGPGRPCGLIGDGGAGKNLTAQSIALHVAAGRRLWDRYDVARGRVLILADDAGRLAIKLRNYQLANGLALSREELRDRVVVCSYSEVNLNSHGVMPALRAFVSGFSLVVLDNLRDAVPEDEENDSKFAGHLKAIARACGEQTTCLYLHHTPLSDNGRPRGSGAIKAESGALFALTGEGTEPRQFRNTRAHECMVGLAEPLTLVQQTSDDRGAFDVPALPGAEGRFPRAVWIEATEGIKGGKPWRNSHYATFA